MCTRGDREKRVMLFLLCFAIYKEGLKSIFIFYLLTLTIYDDDDDDDDENIGGSSFLFKKKKKKD